MNETVLIYSFFTFSISYKSALIDLIDLYITYKDKHPNEITAENVEKLFPILI